MSEVSMADVLKAIQNMSAQIEGMERRLTDRIEITEARLSQRIEQVREQVAENQEKLTELEKIKNLFNEEALEAAEKVAK